MILRARHVHFMFLMIFSLAYFRFFRPVGVPDVMLKLVYYSLLCPVVMMAIKPYLSCAESLYGPLLRVLLVSVVLSIVPAFLFWEQGPIDTFISTIPYFTFFFYFFLQRQKISPEMIEKIIWVFCILFVLCFFAALAVAPQRLFLGYGELDKEIDVSRGLSRIRLTLIGAGPLYLAYFMSLNKYKIAKEITWLAVSVFLFVVIVLQLGRQSIFYSFLLTLMFFSVHFSLKKRIFFIFIAASVSLYMISYDPIVTALLQKTHAQYEQYVEGQKEEVRIAAYKFYAMDVSPSVFTTIFGNGVYSLNKSRYGNFVEFYGRMRGYIPADVGYAVIILFFGIFGVAVFILIFLKVLRQKVPERYLYAKYYIAFLMLGSITGNTLLGSIPTYCMALYVLDCCGNGCSKELS